MGQEWNQRLTEPIKDYLAIKGLSNTAKLFGMPASEIVRLARCFGFAQLVDLTTRKQVMADATLTERLMEMYPNHTNSQISKTLLIPLSILRSTAAHIGLKKSPEHISQVKAKLKQTNTKK